MRNVEMFDETDRDINVIKFNRVKIQKHEKMFIKKEIIK
jgi:hypothetical protein